MSLYTFKIVLQLSLSLKSDSLTTYFCMRRIRHIILIVITRLDAQIKGTSCDA